MYASLSRGCIGVGIWRCFCLTLCFHTVIQFHCFRVCLSVHLLFGNPNIISSSRIGALPFHSTQWCLISQTTFSFMPSKLQNITIHFAQHVLFSWSLQGRMHACHMLCSNTCTYVIMYSAHTKCIVLILLSLSLSQWKPKGYFLCQVKGLYMSTWRK